MYGFVFAKKQGDVGSEPRPPSSKRAGRGWTVSFGFQCDGRRGGASPTVLTLGHHARSPALCGVMISSGSIM